MVDIEYISFKKVQAWKRNPCAAPFNLCTIIDKMLTAWYIKKMHVVLKVNSPSF